MNQRPEYAVLNNHFFKDFIICYGRTKYFNDVSISDPGANFRKTPKFFRREWDIGYEQAAYLASGSVYEGHLEICS